MRALNKGASLFVRVTRAESEEEVEEERGEEEEERKEEMIGDCKEEEVWGGRRMAERRG